MTQNDEIDLRQLWNVIARRKWAIVSLGIGFGILATLVVFTVKPVYQASATILIESQQANVVSIQEVYGLDPQNQQYYASQFEILKSRPIVESVISSLGLSDIPEFNLDNADKGFDFSWQSWMPGIFVNPAPRTEYDVTQRAVEIYSEKLSVNPVRNTQLVHVRFESEDPVLAARVADTHAEAYIESILEARLSVTQSASGWMSRRIAGLQETLLDSEKNLQEFRETERLVDVEGLKSLPAQEVTDLTSRLMDARRRLSLAKIAHLQVYGTSDGRAVKLENIPAVQDDKVVQEFQRAEAVAQQKVAELQDIYGPQHPRMVAAQAELAKASENLAAQQGSVAASFENEYEAAQSEVTELERALRQANQQYQQIGRKESSLAALQSEVDTNRQLYELFYSRMKETAETGDLDPANARIISPAVVPYKPSKPRKKLIVGLAAFAGLALGVIAAFVLESLNNTIRSSADVEEKLGLPLLGMLPILHNKEESRSIGQEFFDRKEIAFNEAIRTVRTGVSLSSLDSASKVTLVTSSIAGEGKSTVALNLAFAFAQLENVLLIDCDFRRPSIGQSLGIDANHPGLSELIAQIETLEGAVSYVDNGGFAVLPCGVVPPDPLSLLSSQRAASLFRKFGRVYDRVIIDSPPVVPVSDAVVLSTYADSVVFVVKSDSTSVSQVKTAVSRLQRVDAAITGVVVEQLDARLAEKYSDYGYEGYDAPYEPLRLVETKRAVG